MGVRAGRMFATLLAVLCGPLAGPALAAWAGSDPSSNFGYGPLPSACQTAPTGSVCINASVSYLNQARASLGQPPYILPSDFVSLTPAQQVLVLTDLDRTLYNLPPIAGLTDALDNDAAAAVPTDSDPTPSSSDWWGFTSNAAWGNPNVVLAYESWMYYDGPGSDNVDCSSSNPGACWGHRHDILWEFGPGALAMGAAAGRDNSGNTSYTMLLFQGSPSYSPVYNYTWAQAVANGAGGTSASPATPGSASGVVAAASHTVTGQAAVPVAEGARLILRIRNLRVRGHQISVSFTGPAGASLSCSLSRAHGRLRRVKRCTRSVSFGRLPAGRYWLRISSGAASVSRRVVIR